MAKRGRPRADEIAARHEAIIAAALDELVEHGYDKVTMLGIARRAGASKETLYSRFGSRAGLFETLIAHQAGGTVERLEAALDGAADPETTLTGFATALLELLLHEPSVSLNRAAMASPELAALLLRHGRHASGPVVERYLAELGRRGALDIPDPGAAFSLLYGLVVEDRQIRVLLGEEPPPRARIARHAASAVARFVALHRL